MTIPRKITSVEELDALPVGSVIVDPYDDAGDAPVVACRAVHRWELLTAGNSTEGDVWRSEDIIYVSHGRLLAVYVPGVRPR